MKPIVLIPLAVILFVGGIFAWSKATGRWDAHREITNANAELNAKLCSLERYGGKLLDCSRPNGPRYYRTRPADTVVDAPEGIYDEQGNFVVFCGGFVPQEVAEKNQPICDQYPMTNCTDITSICN